MNRLSLRWVILLPLLATITVGFVVFAVYIDHSDRGTRLAEIDRELARAERVEPGPPAARPPTGDTTVRSHRTDHGRCASRPSTSSSRRTATSRPRGRDESVRLRHPRRPRVHPGAHGHRGRRSPGPGLAPARRAGRGHRPVPRGLPRRDRCAATDPAPRRADHRCPRRPRWRGGWPGGWSGPWPRWRPRPTRSPAGPSTPRCSTPAARVRSRTCRATSSAWSRACAPPWTSANGPRPWPPGPATT